MFFLPSPPFYALSRIPDRDGTRPQNPSEEDATPETMLPDTTYRTFRTFTVNEGKTSPLPTDLIVESPLQIIVNDQPHTLLMCTPHMVQELTIGFLFTEGLIAGPNDIIGLDIRGIRPDRRENQNDMIEARVWVPPGGSAFTRIPGRRISYSSCGICGTETYDRMKEGLDRIRSRTRFSMEMLRKISSTLKTFQPLYRKTKGAHAAFLFDAKGSKILHAEDMGRHNALDKVIGALLVQKISPRDKMLVSSGRASLEMILKTTRIGIALFAAMSRPTSLAVEAAKFYNLTLVDLAKDRNRIYSHARRIEEF